MVRLRVLPRAQVLNIWKLLWCLSCLDRHEDSEHARNTSNGISSSVSENDGHYLSGSVPRVICSNSASSNKNSFSKTSEINGNWGWHTDQLIISPPFTFPLITTIPYKIRKNKNIFPLRKKKKKRVPLAKPWEIYSTDMGKNLYQKCVLYISTSLNFIKVLSIWQSRVNLLVRIPGIWREISSTPVLALVIISCAMLVELFNFSVLLCFSSVKQGPSR